jgi:predicted RNA-binding protein YlxR (DUF448 family)
MEKSFQTTDLYLASALKISGFRLIDLKKNSTGRGIFLFQNRSDKEEIIKKYFSGELSGSLKAFANPWADLKALVNEIE